ncbi:MAG: pseudouridylate synthase [Prevotella sp.]|jgi:predicted hotdog family 3-hydroxylacyl-ACP dehydratase|nr:pseudouridylate synthase [Prevotella sp.]
MITEKPNFTPSFLRQIDIHSLIPQQEPFVMIGCLSYIDERRTITETTVSEDNIFVDEGFFSFSGLVENIAQTCAAGIGFVNKNIRNKDIQVGFIGAIRNLEVFELPRVGDTITTTVDIIEEVFGMTLAHAQIVCGEKTLVTTEIKIALKGGQDGTESIKGI